MPLKRASSSLSPQRKGKKKSVKVPSPEHSSSSSSSHRLPQPLHNDQPPPPASSDDDATLLFPGTCYSVKDVVTLCGRIKDNLPLDDSLKFSLQRRKIDWSKVAFNRYDASAASSMWTELQNTLKTYKTMTDLVNELITRVNDNSCPKKPLTAYFEYYTRNREAYLSKNPGLSAIELTRALSEEYSRLPFEEKQRYKELSAKNFSKCKDELEISFPHLVKQRPPKKPRTPQYYYLESCIKKQLIDKSLDKKERWNHVRELYCNLPDEEKLKYIKKSFKDQEKYEKELAEYRIIHPEYKGSTRSILSKVDIAILNRTSGRPVKPPISGYAIFTRKVLPLLKGIASIERMIKISTLWKEVPDVVKAGYEFESQVAISEYLTTFDEFVSKLPADERQKIVREEKIKYPSGAKLETLRVAIDANTKSKSMKFDDLFKEPGLVDDAVVFYTHEKFLDKLESNHSYERDDHLEEAKREWFSLKKSDKKRYLQKAFTCRCIHQETERKFCGKLEKLLPQKPVTSSRKCDLEILKSILDRRPKEKLLNGYAVFFSKKSTQVQASSAREKMRIIGRMWKELTDAEKSVYESEAKIIKERVKSELEKFEKSLTQEELALFRFYNKNKRKLKGSKKSKGGQESSSADMSDGSSNKSDDSHHEHLFTQSNCSESDSSTDQSEEES